MWTELKINRTPKTIQNGLPVCGSLRLEQRAHSRQEFPQFQPPRLKRISNTARFSHVAARLCPMQETYHLPISIRLSIHQCTLF